ncbi:hypothetical protein ACFL60_07285 [Candidatus Omnitrophota bacterium]
MKDNQTRRNFFGIIGTAGFGLAAAGGMISGCTSGSTPSDTENPETMLGQYFHRFSEILTAFRDEELDKIGQAADMAAECFMSGGKLYSTLGGHLFQKDGGDTANDRIGNPVLFNRDTEDMKTGDFLVTMGASQAKDAQEKGIKVVGWTSPFRRKGDTPPLGLEKPQDMILEEVCDVTIECHVPYTDGILYSEKIHVRPIPGSGQMTLIFYWTLTAAIVERLAEKGKNLTVAGA